MRYKAILLDFYGTCVAEDDLIIEKIITEIATHSGAAPKEILNAWKFSEACSTAYGADFRLQKDIELSSLNDVLIKFGVDLDVMALSNKLFEYWAKPQIFADTLGFLRRQSVPVIIVSNIDNSFIKSALQFIDFDFCGVITSEDVRSYKPRTEPFMAALELAELTPQDVVHIGDSYSSDVFGARKCGIQPIWINRNNRTIQGGSICPQVSTLSEIELEEM